MSCFDSKFCQTIEAYSRKVRSIFVEFVKIVNKNQETDILMVQLIHVMAFKRRGGDNRGKTSLC
jgi:hypothetical protein